MNVNKNKIELKTYGTWKWQGYQKKLVHSVQSPNDLYKDWRNKK